MGQPTLHQSGEQVDLRVELARSGVTAGPLNCAALPIRASSVWWKRPKAAAQHRARAAAT
jgi:hypothetical protein